ncbi:MAG: efflux RND transporter periplasmic adaptor subunit [Peptococcaceae bacterium]|nr:efflux RND transporter periplasmic adaptor subunit [Peptococcaceae bacterium]
MRAVLLAEKLGRRKKALAGAGLALIIVLAVVLNLVRGREGSQVPVQTARAEMKEIQDSVPATGRVRLVEKQDIFAGSAAKVKSIHVRPGDRVIRGQLLIVLDISDVEVSLEEARANLELQEARYAKAVAELPLEIQRLKAGEDKARAALERAKTNLERYRALYRAGAVSTREYEDALAEYQSCEADFKTARANLEAKEPGPVASQEIRSLEAQVKMARAQYEKEEMRYNRTHIKAEMDGTVFTVEVSEGEAVAAQARLITLGNPDRLEVYATVSEGDSGRLNTGQKVEIKAAAMPDRKFMGILSSVSLGTVAKTNERGGTSMEIPVVVAVGGDIGGLRPGYTADLNIITTERKTALVVPYEAVVDKEDGRKYVFVVEGKTARQKEIKTGLNTELYTEVLSGLNEGDRVILNPGEKIRDGIEVKELPALKTGSREGEK